MREPGGGTQAARIGALMKEMMILVGRSGAGPGLQVLQRVDLSIPQIVSLQIMRTHGPQTVSALAARVRLSAGAVSRLVDQLVAKRLVDRSESEEDRRQKVLRLTPAGARLIDAVDSARQANLQKILARLDGALAHDLEGVLQRVVESLKAASGRERAEGSRQKAAPPALEAARAREPRKERVTP